MSKAIKTIGRIGLFAGLVAVSWGAFRYLKRQVKLATKYCYKISNVKFVKLNKERMIIDLHIKVLNRSNFEVLLKGYNLSLYINDTYVLDVSNKISSVVKADGISEFVVRVDFDPYKTKLNPQKILDLISYAVFDKSKFIIQVKGTLNAQLNFIQIKDMPIDFRTSLEQALAPPKEDNSDFKCEIDWGE